MGFTDIIYYVLMYFGLLVGVWGFAIAFYFGETGVFMYGGAPPEKLSAILHTASEAASSPEDSWLATDLLEAGQGFEYAIKTTHKGINISYEIIREFGGGFLVLGKARIESEAKKAGALTFSMEAPLYSEDRFMVDKTSGIPKASTYTASFWDAGPCIPPKSYFYGRSLAPGARWNVSFAEQETVEVVEVEYHLGYECFVGKIGSARLVVCRETPLIVEYKGEWCEIGGEIEYAMTKFTRAGGRAP